MHSSRTLRRHAPAVLACPRYALLYGCRSHVVEQHGLGAMLERLFEFGKGAYLDLNGLFAAAIAVGALERRRNPACQRNVIVLDEHSIGEVEAVVVPATAADSVFIQHTQAGDGLARI